MVNSIFARYNPSAKPSSETGSDLTTDRLVGVYTGTDRNTDGYYAKGKTATQLLELVYHERQREFVGEGKFWFDLVREAEAINDPTTALTSYMSMTTSVRNRLRQIYSLYNPIYSEELKANGPDSGGGLIQNPVWNRYTKK